MASNHFRDAVTRHAGRLSALRRDLHSHPELGFQEFRTAGIVARELSGLGLEVSTGVGKTGVVGVLEGGRPGKTVLARFDMDALPVTEQTGAAYASQTPGVMHACGHDGHVSIGLTVARMLSDVRGELAGRVKFVFQPAEEGQGGAAAMIADGVLENPRPDLALALHLWNEKPVGWVAIVPGPLFAGGDTFHVRLEGIGGHAALPDQTVDPVLAAAQVVTALQSIVSRNVSPFEASVLSVTRIQAGEAFNVIPPYAELTGTLRTFKPEVRERMVKRFEQVVRGVAEGMGCEAALQIDEVTPPVKNDPEAARRLARMAERDFPDLDLDTGYQSMVSEDMAYILQKAPGVMMLVGSANPEKGLTFGHHHPRFDFDERALSVGAALMAQSILELCGGDEDGN